MTSARLAGGKEGYQTTLYGVNFTCFCYSEVCKILNFSSRKEEKFLLVVCLSFDNFNDQVTNYTCSKPSKIIDKFVLLIIFLNSFGNFRGYHHNFVPWAVSN